MTARFSSFGPAVSAEAMHRHDLIEGRFDRAKALPNPLYIFDYRPIIDVPADTLGEKTAGKAPAPRPHQGLNNPILAAGEGERASFKHYLFEISYRDVAKLKWLEWGEVTAAVRTQVQGSLRRLNRKNHSRCED